MKVRDLMSRNIARLPPRATVLQAMALMESRHISSVLVERLSEDDPWGIVTRSDVVYRVVARGLDPTAVQLCDVMSRALLTIDPALDFGYASRFMRRFGIRHLPVLDGQDLVGILSYHDVLRVFTLLVSVPFFRELGVDDLIALLQIAAVRTCPAGSTLIHEGNTDHDLFLLDEGDMVVSTRRAGRIARIRQGEFFGEVELFGGQRSATVRAARDSRVLVFDGQRFLELVAQRERLGFVVYGSMARVLSERLRRANRFLFLRGIWAHRLTVLRAAAIAAAAFLSLVLGTAAVSESPAFCLTCHYMRPYQTSWSVSPHRDVTCTNCHKSYGLEGALSGKITGVAMVVRYATKTYAPKPEAKVDDASCLQSGCHSTGTQTAAFRIISDDSSRGREVWFDHPRHLRPLAGVGKLRCTSCHAHREQEEHFSVSPSTCFLCHFSTPVTSSAKCRTCHDMTRNSSTQQRLRVDHRRLAKDADCLACHRTVVGSPAVDEARCTACHLRRRQLPNEEMHRVHVLAADVDCLDCHSTIAHPGPEGPILSGRCETCHPGEHADQERLYLGEGGVGVAGRPALMFYMHVECTACHRAEIAGADSARSPGHAAAMAGQACLDCHDLTAADQARMWMRTIEESLARVRGDLARFEAAAGPGGPDGNSEAYRLYAEARRNYEIVSADPSAAIHNFRYAQDLMRVSEQRLQTALSLLGAGDGGER